MASRVAGRRIASAGFSLARRSSIRSAAGVGPDEVVLQHGLEVRLLPHLLEEGQPNLGIVDRHVARPQHGAAFALRGERRAGRRPGTASAPRVRWKSGMAAQRSRIRSISAGWNGYDAADAVPQRQPLFLGLLPLGRALGVGPPHLRDGLLDRPSRRGATPRRSGSLASRRRWMTDRISFPSTGSRRWSLRAAR